VLPSRLKKLYCISLLALPIFLDNSLYCLSSGSDHLQDLCNSHCLLQGFYYACLKSLQEWVRRNKPPKQNQTPPNKEKWRTKKLHFVGKTTIEAEVKTLPINCRE
jgi:hypothetical protein